MALNTREKRGSVIGLSPVAPTLPAPDGAIGNPDRAQLAHTYAGLQAVNAPPAGWRIIRAGDIRATIRARA